MSFKRFLKKQIKFISLLAVGFTVIIVFQKFSEKEPDFISEHGILTERYLFLVAILLWVRDFFYPTPTLEELNEDMEKKIQACEKHVISHGEEINKIKPIINNNFESVSEREETLNLRIRKLEDELRRVSLCISDHTWDCYDKWQCQECGAISDEVILDSDWEGMCDKCNMPTSFKNFRQSWHVSKKPKSPSTKQKRTRK